MPDTSAIPQGRVQPLRSFTAQVRRGEKRIKGTAFAVQHDPPLLVTCRHVVKAVADTCEIGAMVHIYFPNIRENDNKLFTAKVHQLPDGGEDDVALLKLDAERFPSGVEVAILGDAKDSVGYAESHKFRSFGFRRLSKYQGLPALGEIIEFTSKPADKTLLGDPLMLMSQHIDSGMSGAPVLDLQRNLVVGVVSETWKTSKAKDDDTCFAVDGRVLSMKQLNLALFDGYQLTTTHDAPIDEKVQATVESVAPQINFPLKPTYRPTQPSELPEWAGRVELLGKLDQDYADETVNITGLIGFGGEGKSSIAYRWLTKNALMGNYPPDASFWWSFYENRSFEQMVEGLIEYLYGEQNLQGITGTAQRVNFIGAMALTRRLILVLDGFEVMQEEEEGDKFGTLPNQDMVRLLELFGQSSQSFCLVTSRVPLMDFINHTAYVQRDVTRLTPEDGRDLLRKLGVDGDDDQLDPIVSDWEGHALTVSLVGSYLGERGISIEDYNKDIFPKVEVYQDEVPRYRQVRRILERYDENLTEADKAFLKLFSVFRLPVPESAFGRVFRADTGSTLNTDLHGLDDAQFEGLITHLVERRLIRKAEDKGTITYNAHPLVQRHYRKALEGEHNNTDVQPIHKIVADHYQENAEHKYNPTLDDLKPYIEVVHHLCRAGAYDEGYSVYRERIDQGDRWVITSVLGAYETEMHLLLEFFPNKDTTQEPQVSKNSQKRFILHEVGFCLQNLGQLRESAPFYERVIEGDLKDGRHQHASQGYQNLADLYLQLGELEQMQDSAEQALSEARGGGG